VVYLKAVQLLATSRELVSDLDEVRGLRRGQLVIGIPGMGTSTLLADAMATYKLRYPLIDLKVELSSQSELMRQLREYRLEVAALLEEAPDGIHFRPLLEDELMVLLPASHPLSTNRGIGLGALKGMPLFLPEHDVPAAQAVMQAFKAAGIEPRIAARTNNLDVLYELVKSGAGASFVPSRIVAARTHRATVAVPLHGMRIPWRLSLGWISGRHLSHAAHAWIGHVFEDRVADGSARGDRTPP
jgi:DNA-binding transcriptional LysR family regulator